MKKHLLPLILGLAGVFAIATAFGTGDEPLEEPEDDGVVLGEEDLAERGEILRNQFRRMTPGDEPLVQDIGTWPAAWEEFGTNWDSATADREYGAWVVPVELTQENGTTVMKDGEGNELWRGTTDFARLESSDVVLTGGLVAEEDWAVYEAVRGAVEEMTAEASRVYEPAPTRTIHTNGLRFTFCEWTTNDSFHMELAYEVDTNVDLFVYAVAHTSAWVVATWTNDENVAITDTNLVWYSAGEPFNGRDSTWEYLDTVAIDNGEAEYEDSSFSAGLGRLRYYAAAVANDSDGDGLSDGQEAFISHTDPVDDDSDHDGIDDPTELAAGTNPSHSNVWWVTKTTNVWVGYGHEYLGNQPSWPNYPIWKTDLTVTGEPAVTNSVPVGVTLWGLVDDAIQVDGQPVPETWTNGAIGLSGADVTGLIENLTGKSFQIDLYDWPDLPDGGDNEIRLGTTNEPFRVEWEWRVPIDIRMEPIWTSETLPLNNPSGIILGSNAWFHVDVFPEGLVPEEQIAWESQGGKLEFVTTNTGSRVEVCATNAGDATLRVEVQGSVGDFGLPPFHVKVMPLTVVTAKVGVVVNANGDWAVASNTISSIIADANLVLSQVGKQIVVDGDYIPIDAQEGYWDVVLQTAGVQQLRSVLSNPGGLEIYFVNSITRTNQELAAGANHITGMLISAVGTGITLAHEFCHACGASDIYEAHSGTDLKARGKIREEWMPQDWGAYATDEMTLPDIYVFVRRLLMYGYTRTNSIPPKGDVPSGAVFGLGDWGYPEGWKTNLWLGVGLQGMFQTPVHH